MLHGMHTKTAFNQLRSEGFRFLYRGILPPLCQKTVSVSVMFGMYSVSISSLFSWWHQWINSGVEFHSIIKVFWNHGFRIGTHKCGNRRQRRLPDWRKPSWHLSSEFRCSCRTNTIISGSVIRCTPSPSFGITACPSFIEDWRLSFYGIVLVTSCSLAFEKSSANACRSRNIGPVNFCLTSSVAHW